MLRETLATALIALTASACCSSRVATNSNEQLRVEGLEFKDSVRVERLFELDTLKEMTIITVQINDKGDTLRIVQMTERERIRDATDVRSQKVVVRVEHDTVYVAVHDSVSTTNCTNFTNERSRASPVVSALKWVFWIIIAITVLIIILKLSRI